MVVAKIQSNRGGLTTHIHLLHTGATNRRGRPGISVSTKYDTFSNLRIREYPKTPFIPDLADIKTWKKKGDQII